MPVFEDARRNPKFNQSRQKGLEQGVMFDFSHLFVQHRQYQQEPRIVVSNPAVAEYLDDYIPKKNSDSIVLDRHSVEGKKTQDDWIKHWKSVKDGRVMASMGDFYQAFKQIKQEGDQELLASLREDFDWPGKSNWLISSTRLEYNGDNLDTKIIPHYGCNKSELTSEKTIVVPFYREEKIANVVSETDGLCYLQTLLDTEDSAEEIISIMEFVSGKNRSDIKVWTPLQDFRDSYPKRAAGFDYDFDDFLIISGNDIDSNLGCSRGVLL